jgi:Zn-dependent protease with chaperone function
VRLNRADRSFFTLVATALVPYVFLGVFGCGLLSVAVYRLATNGWSGLHRNGEDLRPAVVFFGVVTSGTVIAALSVRRQVQATHRLATFVAGHTVASPAGVDDAAIRAHLAGRVVVLDDAQPCSFTYGLLSARVVVSRGLVDAVSADELEAVLQHEHYHVRSWDTLKVVVARAAPSAFFFLPALRHLRDRYLAGRELAADRQAIRAVGERPLAAALFKATDGPAWAEFGAAAALGGSTYLDQRVEQLETGEEPAIEPLPRAAAWLTVVGLVLLTGAFVWATVAGGRTAMSMDGSMSGGGLGSVLAVVGGAACMGAWAAAGVILVRGGISHRPAR